MCSFHPLALILTFGFGVWATLDGAEGSLLLDSEGSMGCWGLTLGQPHIKQTCLPCCTIAWVSMTSFYPGRFGITKNSDPCVLELWSPFHVSIAPPSAYSKDDTKNGFPMSLCIAPLPELAQSGGR